jgi:hypothetical protein
MTCLIMQHLAYGTYNESCGSENKSNCKRDYGLKQEIHKDEIHQCRASSCSIYLLLLVSAILMLCFQMNKTNKPCLNNR